MSVASRFHSPTRCNSWLAAIGLVLALAPSPALADAPAADQLAQAQAPKNEVGHHVSRHYLYSNERRHDAFFPDIRDLGQGYLGVGSDQNYTLAAAQKADFVWLIDLDATVTHLHDLYGAAIARSETADAFLALFSGQKDAELEQAVNARFQDAKQRRAALQVYKDYGPTLLKRLRRSQRVKNAGEDGNWLNDPALYGYVRKLVLENRIIARVGDLLGPTTVVQVAEAARAAKVTIRVIYLSNAESWFSYSPRFVRNFQALPLDDKSVVLRTIKSNVVKYVPGDVWHYSVQGGADFVNKISAGRYGNLDRVMADLVAQPGGPGGPRKGVSRIAVGIPAGAKVVEGLVTRPQASPEGSIPALENRPPPAPGAPAGSPAAPAPAAP